MERKRNGVINLLVLLAVGVSIFPVARYASSLSAHVAAAFVGLGLLAALVSWFQMGLEERERLEKLELDELMRSRGSSTLFEADDSESLPAQRSREQFEKVFVPALSVLFLILQGAGAWWLWTWVRKQPSVASNTLVAISLFGIFALVLFMVGKYSVNLARLQKERLLRPSAGYLLLSAYVLAAVIAGLVAWEAGFPKVDQYVALALCVLLGILAVENLLTLLLEIYRPRGKGKVDRVLYESRLVGLLGQPEGLFTTVAHAIDYQFGFKVSDTGFYRFLEKYLPRLLIAQLAILLLSTCFVFISAGEEGLMERFGQPVAGGKILGPGFHLKLPWPIDRVYRERTQEIRRFDIGFVHEEEGEGHEEENKGPLLWTVKHYKTEFNLLVASREGLDTNSAAGRKSPPVNLLSVSIPVQYQITDLRAWTYTHGDPAKLLEQIGTRETVRYLVSADFHELMSSARFNAAEDLRQRIQDEANRQNLGVKILFLGLQDIHPPVQVAAAYESVAGALQTRQAKLLDAEAHKVQTNALAISEAVRRKRVAEADRQRAEATAKGRSAFTNQIMAYRAAPEVYTMRSYLGTLSRAGSGSRKIVLATTNAQDVMVLNLEEKLNTGLLGAPLPATSK
jgi:regulator of protease activity HflC (stomatin/prohibitin superfamily)